MATILEFRASRERTAKGGARLEQAAGEIVIFPGVRYERATAQDAPRPAEPQIERDMLKLAE